MKPTLTMQDRYDITQQFKAADKPNKTAIGKGYSISARTVGRCIDLIESMSIEELLEEGVTLKAVDMADYAAAQQPAPVQVFIMGDKVTYRKDTLTDSEAVLYRDDHYNIVDRVEGDKVYYTNTGWDYAENLEFYVEKVVEKISCCGSCSGSCDKEEEPTVEAPQFIVTPLSVVVVIDGNPVSMDSSHANFTSVKMAITEENWSELELLMDIPKAVTEYTQGKISVVNGSLSYAGFTIDNTLTRYVLERMQQGQVPSNVMNFMENLMENPSKDAVNELYDFIRKTDLPITEDGYFLAYKKVRDDYLDCHSATIDNSVGEEPSMPRFMVDDVRTNHCSKGLHFCSEGYLNSFGGSRTMILKINPADVVSIPNDYDFAKGRTWKYKVVGELSQGEKIGSLFQEV